MSSTELGTCEWFVWDLRRSNLVDRGQLDQLVCEFLKKNTRPEPPALAQYLVDQTILTPFQADRLLQGKSQGLVLGPYTLMDALGSGSMGTVYKALNKIDNRWYAVKVLPRRSMWNVRIARRQVRAFEQADHPAVVPFVDVGTAGGTHYLAWPLVEGEPLDAVVARAGKLSPGAAAWYVLQTAEGLDNCHRKGIIHGMLKPSNLMVTADGQIRILDYGIGSILANSEGESLVDTMSTANSLTSGLDCASPECIIEPTNRTPAGDQYSLGCVLYYCLAGQFPFPEGTAVEKMMAHQSKQPTPLQAVNPDVPAELAEIVDRLMQKNPNARFASVGDVAEALRPFAEAPAPAAVRPSRPKPGCSGAGPSATAPERSTASPQRDSRGRSPGNPETPRLPTGFPAREGFQSANPAPLPSVLPDRARAVPRNPILVGEGQAGRAESLDERLGPVGVFVGALMAACLTWLLSLWLFR